MAAARMAFSLWPKQLEAMGLLFRDGVNQLVYGGAAGGGKSEVERAYAFTLANLYPGARVPIFRKTEKQLAETHIPKWLYKMEQLGYDRLNCWHVGDREWHFPRVGSAPSSIVEFRHVDTVHGVDKWLSAEWAGLAIDETSAFMPRDIQMLYSRVRRPDEDYSAMWKGWHPTAIYATNPGGDAHAYLKTTFIDEAEMRGGSGAVWDVDEELGEPYGTVTIRRSFLQSMLVDNPSINPSEYVASLAQLSQQDRARMLAGDWSYFEGKVFATLDPLIHYVDFEPPPFDWPRVLGYDHGNQNPAAAIWICRDGDGNYIAYDEYYSAGVNSQHIAEIKNRMMEDGHELVLQADPQMWRKEQSGSSAMYSAAEEFMHGGSPDEPPGEHGGLQLKQPTLTRSAGRSAIQRMLDPQPDRLFPSWHPLSGQSGAPRLFISKRCPNLWWELNGIKWTPLKEDTEKVDDHAYDALWHAAPLLQMAGRTRRQPRRLVAAGAR